MTVTKSSLSGLCEHWVAPERECHFKLCTCVPLGLTHAFSGSSQSVLP